MKQYLYTPSYSELIDKLAAYNEENNYSWVQPCESMTVWGKRIISLWNINGRIARYDKRTNKMF